MEAIMIAGIAVVVVGGWYSAVDLLGDMGFRIGKRSRAGMKGSGFSSKCGIPAQRGIKQMAGVNI